MPDALSRSTTSHGPSVVSVITTVGRNARTASASSWWPFAVTSGSFAAEGKPVEVSRPAIFSPRPSPNTVAPSVPYLSNARIRSTLVTVTLVPCTSVTVVGIRGVTSSLIGTMSGSATVAVLGPVFCRGSFGGSSRSNGVRLGSGAGGAFPSAGAVQPASTTVSTATQILTP